MKKIYFIALLAFLLLGFNKVKAQYLHYEPLPVAGQSNASISDGWYNATVVYQNFTTNYKAKYSLKVKVERNSIVAIKFSDGELHSGYNSSGYSWSGGYISIQKDLDGEITSATATVKIVDSDVVPKVYTIYLM